MVAKVCADRAENTKLKKPVDEYLASFSTNKALLDIIAQHFFQKTPTFFALSYFSLYLDYRYPRGRNGASAQALEQFVLETAVKYDEKPKSQVLTRAKASNRSPRQRLPIQETGLGSGPKVALPGSRHNIHHGQQGDQRHRGKKKAVAGKIGGDSVFTFYLTVDLESTLCGNMQPALLLHAILHRSFSGEPGGTAH